MQLATMRLRNGLWRAVTDDGKTHDVLDQFPEHAVLRKRHDGKQALVQVYAGEGGTAARFLRLDSKEAPGRLACMMDGLMAVYEATDNAPLSMDVCAKCLKPEFLRQGLVVERDGKLLTAADLMAERAG